jgi:hypothetical protein
MTQAEELEQLPWHESGWAGDIYWRRTFWTYPRSRTAVEPSLLLASEFQPAQAPAPGEDPPVELQLSFFETPGFMQTPQGGGS